MPDAESDIYSVDSQWEPREACGRGFLAPITRLLRLHSRLSADPPLCPSPNDVFLTVPQNDVELKMNGPPISNKMLSVARGNIRHFFSKIRRVRVEMSTVATLVLLNSSSSPATHKFEKYALPAPRQCQRADPPGGSCLSQRARVRQKTSWQPLFYA